MPKYLITWNIGYGENEEVIDADSDQEAEAAAYDAAREDFESNAEYAAIILTPEVAEEHGIDLDDPHASVSADQE